MLIRSSLTREEVEFYAEKSSFSNTPVLRRNLADKAATREREDIVSRLREYEQTWEIRKIIQELACCK